MKKHSARMYAFLVLIVVGCRQPLDPYGLTTLSASGSIQELDEDGISAMFKIQREVEFQELTGEDAALSLLVSAHAGTSGVVQRWGVYRQTTMVCILCIPNKQRCSRELVVVVSGLPKSPKLHGVYEWVLREYK